MSNFLRQATAAQARAIGPFLDDTDFKTAETGLTIANTDIKLIVNGGASADKNSGGGTHRANGVYGVTFDATDTATVGELEVSVKVAGALPVFKTFYVLEEAVFDAMFAASAVGPLLANDTGTGFTAIPWNASWDAEVQSEVTDALNAYDPPTKAELDAADDAMLAAIAALNDLDAAGIRAALGMAAADLDTQLAALPTADEVRDAIFARAYSAAYGAFTFDELTKLMAAVLLGKASGLGTTTATYRNLNDSADSVVATVDADGNRSAVTRTP